MVADNISGDLRQYDRYDGITAARISAGARVNYDIFRLDAGSGFLRTFPVIFASTVTGENRG